MSYFKRFTDFCGGFAAFAAIIHLIRQFMTFNISEDKGMLEKLKQFLDKDRAADYRGYVIMIALFAISVLVGVFFERLPYVSFAVSLAPFFQVINLYSSDKLTEHPTLYILLGFVHIAGNIIHALSLDRIDGKRRAFACANICGGAILAFGAWLWFKVKDLAAYEDAFEDDSISRLERKISIAAEENFQHLVLNMVIMVAVTVVIALLLRDIYFIDAVLAAVPFFYCVYTVLLKDELIIFGELMLGATFFYFLCRMLLVVFEPMRTPKKKLKPTK